MLHPAPGVHLLKAGCTYFETSAPACLPACKACTHGLKSIHPPSKMCTQAAGCTLNFDGLLCVYFVCIHEILKHTVFLYTAVRNVERGCIKAGWVFKFMLIIKQCLK